MEFLGVEKIESGRHLNYYRAMYKNRLNSPKVYEFISRDSKIKNGSDLHNRESQAVVLAVFDKDFSHILLNSEFRLAVNEVVYNMPAGLIDKGETEVEAAIRELDEETGLHLDRVIKVLPSSYSSVGISNEKTNTIICVADGEIGGHPEADEEIECHWYSKDEVREILKSPHIAARTQMLCYMWVEGGNLWE